MPNTSIVAKRTIMKKLFVFAALGLLYMLGCGDSSAEQLRDGDIIFQTSRSEQSIAIQKATHSQYSHMQGAWGQSYIIHFAHTQR
jgi:sensor domain CHASE-containing protein